MARPIERILRRAALSIKQTTLTGVSFGANVLRKSENYGGLSVSEPPRYRRLKSFEQVKESTWILVLDKPHLTLNLGFLYV